MDRPASSDPAPLHAWSIGGPLPAGTRVVEEGSGAPAFRRAALDRPGAEALVAGLRRGREALLGRPSAELTALLGRVGERFLAPGDPLREEALARLPASAHVSEPMARAILDGMARDWTGARLEALVEAELGPGADPAATDAGAGAGRAARRAGRALDLFVERPGRPGRTRALGPPFTVHVCSGSVPGVSTTSMVRGLIVKSAVLLKPGRGDQVLPLLFRRGLEEADPAVAGAVAVTYWPGGGGEPLEEVALESADLVVVYGDDETVRAVRGSARATSPVVSYPHRLSFAVVGPGGGDEGVGASAREAARAVALFEQRGCVSPHLVYVLGTPRDAEAFAERLAGALDELSRELPAVAAGPGLASAVHQAAGAAELRAAAGQGRVWLGEGMGWAVVLEPEIDFTPSCLGRFVRVKPAPSIPALLGAVRPWRRHLQTVGVTGLGESLVKLAEGLARLGANRVAPLARVPFPPAWWHHDGEGPLAALLRWTDLEG